MLCRQYFNCWRSNWNLKSIQFMYIYFFLYQTTHLISNNRCDHQFANVQDILNYLHDSRLFEASLTECFHLNPSHPVTPICGLLECYHGSISNQRTPPFWHQQHALAWKCNILPLFNVINVIPEFSVFLLSFHPKVFPEDSMWEGVKVWYMFKPSFFSPWFSMFHSW